MKIDELINFLVEANKTGYAAGNSANSIKERDGSTSIFFQKGDWKFHDNYFGGEPFGGREIIFYKNKPFWIMVYYGQISSSNENIKEVYTFLQKALMISPRELPARGPEKFTDNNFKYTNKWVGDINNFNGEEKIFKEGEQVYSAKYIGGLVDQI